MDHLSHIELSESSISKNKRDLEIRPRYEACMIKVEPYLEGRMNWEDIGVPKPDTV